MLVLFTGGRGSGKTTVARALHAACQERGIRYMHQGTWREHRPLVKAWFVFYFWRFFDANIFHTFFDRLYRDIRSGRSRGSVYRLYVPLIYAYYLSQLANRKVDAVIYDSDVFSWAADKAVDGIFDPTEVRNFYAQFILPKTRQLLVVVFDTPVTEAFERWQKRENKQLSLGERKAWIAKRMRWKQARDKVVEAVDVLPNVTVVRLDGTSSPQASAAQIVAKMQDAS